MKKVFLSLGSNEGDRLDFIKKAIKQISEQIGVIVKKSPVFESPAWGFDGDFFYNMCIEIYTPLPAEVLINTILKIETYLGRIRNLEKGYQSRSIDIDILFYDKEEVDSSTLKIPHLQLHKRRFVLLPLSFIAPKFEHPKFEKTVSELLSVCTDKSSLTQLTVKIP